LAAGPRRSELFLKTFQLVECRQQRPAFSALPSSASGISRTIPLPRRQRFDLNIASIAAMPARVTVRGAARSGSIGKTRGRRGGMRVQLVKIASAPLIVRMFQLSASTSRQWLSG